MTPEETPRPGSWYETDEGEAFLVTAFDEKNDKIDIRYSDGRVDELHLASWYAMRVIEVEPLDEWRRSIDEFMIDRHPKKG